MKLIPCDETSSETVHIADLGFPDSQIRNGWLATNTISEIMDMYMDRVVGEGVFSYYGRQFPILIKTLHCTERTPLLVHPDDEIAEQRFDFLGKAKLWYVTKARPGAKLFLGFNRDVTAEEFYMACRHGQVEELLNVVEPEAGACFFIKPGVIHAACEGLEIVEVAESSPLDFRIFNWGRREELDPFDQELNLEAAFDFITYTRYAAPEDVGTQNGCQNGARRLADCPEFIATELRLADSLRISNSSSDSFTTYLCLSGEVAIQIPSDTEKGGREMEQYLISSGETVLVPAELTDFFLVPRQTDTVLIEVLAGQQADIDGYIDPAADPGDASDDAEDEYADFGNMISGIDLVN